MERSDIIPGILNLISKPNKAREKLCEEWKIYGDKVISAGDGFSREIQKFKRLKEELISEHEKNTKEINKDILSKFSKNMSKIKKVSEALNQSLKTIEDYKVRQKDWIPKNKEFRKWIRETQANLEKYVACKNDIKELSEQECKYNQTLKQVEDYKKDISNLKAKKEYLDDLIKEKSKALRKEKGKKAEATDVYTFMYQDTRITVRKNDLVKEYVDAIVNPANEDLNHAGGAARAIANKAGPEFERECEDYISENYKLKTGSSMVTSAGGELKCGNVIHTVGPIYEKNKKNHSKEFEQLKKCFESILKIMVARDFYDISIPAISTGIFGFPIKKCVEICANTIKNMIDDDPKSFKGKEIILCNVDDKTTTVFHKWIQQYMEHESDDEDSIEERKDNYEDEEFREMKNKGEEDYSSEDDGALNDNRGEAPGDNGDSDY